MLAGVRMVQVCPSTSGYGFGKLDVNAAIELASDWVALPQREVPLARTGNYNDTIPDANNSGITRSLFVTVPSDLEYTIETVDVLFDITHTTNDLSFRVTSPSGMVADVVPFPVPGQSNMSHTINFENFRGERAEGEDSSNHRLCGH